MSRTVKLRYESIAHINGMNTSTGQITGIYKNNCDNQFIPLMKKAAGDDDTPSKDGKVVFFFNAAEANIKAGSTCSSATMTLRYSRELSPNIGVPPTGNFVVGYVECPVGLDLPTYENSGFDAIAETITVSSGSGTFDNDKNQGVKTFDVTSAVNSIISKDTFNEKDLAFFIGFESTGNSYHPLTCHIEATIDESNVDADMYRYFCDTGRSFRIDSSDTDDVDILNRETSVYAGYSPPDDDSDSRYNKVFLTFPINRSEVVDSSDIDEAKLIFHGGTHNPSAAKGVIYGVTGVSDVYEMDLLQKTSTSYSTHNNQSVTTNKSYMPSGVSGGLTTWINYLFEVDVKDLLVECLDDSGSDDDVILMKLEVPSSGTNGGSGQFVVNGGSTLRKNAPVLIVKTTAGSGISNGKVSSGGGGGGGTSSPTFYNPFNSKAIQ